MKIVNTKAGQAYHLTPGTQLEIERPNLFFNEWGEQSLPTDLPDTDLNRQLTNYPDMLANRNKPSANIDCSIQDGDYFMPCRQAILGAKRREKISTSFYMNEGSFLSRISDVTLTDIFGDEIIPGITTVQQGIDFCWSLRDNSHPNFAIFPITVNLDGDRRHVNRINYMNDAGVCIYDRSPEKEAIVSTTLSNAKKPSTIVSSNLSRAIIFLPSSVPHIYCAASSPTLAIPCSITSS